MKREQLTPQQTLDAIGDEVRRTARKAQESAGTPYARLTVAGLIAGTVIVGALGSAVEITNESEGDSKLVAIEDRLSWVITEHQEYSYTHYEDDQPGPIANPQATRISLMERNMEYIPAGVFKMTAVDDENLGFFILMQENDGEKDTPLDYSRIMFSSSKPEPCDFDTDGNQIVIDEYCTPLESNESRGLEYSDGWQGGAVFNDTSITARTRRLHDIRTDNEWCELAMINGSTAIGGPITEISGEGLNQSNNDLSFNINNQNITPRSIYLGVRKAIVAAMRRDAALQTGLPLTNSAGMPLFLMQEEVEFLKKVSEQNGKPIREMSATEYRTAVAFAKLNLTDEYFPGEINPGPTLAMELVEYSENDGEFDHPKNSNGEEITEENQITYNENYYCLPFTSLEGIQQSEKLWWLKEQLGELDGLQPNAGLYLPEATTEDVDFAGEQTDMTDWPVAIKNVDPIEAQILIDQFMVEVGLKSATNITAAQIATTTTSTVEGN